MKAFPLEKRWLACCRASTSAGSAASSFEPEEWNLAACAEWLGTDRVLWASDYPHPEYHPGVVKELREAIARAPGRRAAQDPGRERDRRVQAPAVTAATSTSPACGAIGTASSSTRWTRRASRAAVLLGQPARRLRGRCSRAGRRRRPRRPPADDRDRHRRRRRAAPLHGVPGGRTAGAPGRPCARARCRSNGPRARRRCRDALPGRADRASTSTRCRCAPRCDGREVADATALLSTCKIVKTADELECIRRAQSINEEAMLDGRAARRARASAVPSCRARSCARIFELGCDRRTPSTRSGR